MTKREAVARIKDHQLVHRINESRAIYITQALDMAIDALEERPEGEWIYGEDEQGQDGWFCSECDFFVPWYYEFYKNDINFIRDYKACPHCLAEMITYTGKDHKPIEQKGDKE